MKKRTIAMVTVAALAITSAVTVLAAPAVQNKEDTVIGFVGNESATEADSFMEAVETEAEANGFSCKAVCVPDYELMSECNRLIFEDVDVLIAAPGSDEYAVNMAAAAHANGIPVILQSAGLSNADYDAVVGQRGADGGHAAVVCAGKILAEKKN